MGQLLVVTAGHDHHGRMRGGGQHLVKTVQAARIWQPEIEQYNIHRFGSDMSGGVFDAVMVRQVILTGRHLAEHPPQKQGVIAVVFDK